RGVESVLVTGVATNVCVETTARDAFMYDYYVTMVEDCSAAYDPRMHEATLQNMRQHFGLVASSQEIISIWQRLQQKKVAAL
ncbi:MAG: cysteine hydrolase family protein, partial [Candidatus Binatia bacterium]